MVRVQLNTCQGTKPKAYFYEVSMKFKKASKFLVDRFKFALFIELQDYKSHYHQHFISMKNVAG